MINNFTWFVFLERIVYHMLLSMCPEIYYRTVSKEKVTNQSAIHYKLTNLLAFGSSCFYPVQDVYFLSKHTYSFGVHVCTCKLDRSCSSQLEINIKIKKITDDFGKKIFHKLALQILNKLAQSMLFKFSDVVVNALLEGGGGLKKK